MKRKLVLFDFDGTLTKGDTFIQFILFHKGHLKGFIGFVVFLPLGILYFLRLMDGGVLKEKIASFHFKGESKLTLEGKGSEFIKLLFESDEFYEELINKIRNHKADGDQVCIVSASLSIWIKPFCSELAVDYLCTELKFNDGIFTGKFGTLNCNNTEKANRIKEKYKLTDYSEVIAYGNSSGDEAMYKLAGQVIEVKKGVCKS